MKTSVFIACSLDGYIARANGALDWLPSEGETEGAEDYGYRDFFDSVDALVMGRFSFEKVLSFGKWPYGDKPIVVLSRQALKIPGAISESVSSMAPDPGAVVAALEAQGAKHLYIDGGKTIQGFLQAGLIDVMMVTYIPILIGDGIPLFGPLKKDIKLHHLETRSFDTGLVQSRYALNP